MLDLNSEVVQQQIIDGIFDPTKIEYALALSTKAGYLKLDSLPSDKQITLLCGRGWYSSCSSVKREVTDRQKGDLSVMTLCQKRLNEDTYIDTQGANGDISTAEEKRTRDKEILAEYLDPDRQWLIVYHDDKYLYNLKTNQPIKVVQTPWIINDTTIFN